MYFSKSHEWVEVDGEHVTVGISHYAQKELGEVVYAELPHLGEMLDAQGVAVVLESTKAAVDIDSPLSGEVIDVNLRLKERPDLVNLSPENEGWLFKLRLSQPDQLSSLMSASDYQCYIRPIL